MGYSAATCALALLPGLQGLAVAELVEGAYASEDTLHSSVAFLRNTLTGECVSGHAQAYPPGHKHQWWQRRMPRLMPASRCIQPVHRHAVLPNLAGRQAPPVRLAAAARLRLSCAPAGPGFSQVSRSVIPQASDVGPEPQAWASVRT